MAAFRDRSGGAPRIGRRPSEEGDFLELPCGRCIGCRQDRAREWSIRIVHEAMCHDRSRFVTLSYAELDRDRLSLNYTDFQLFMKRLRKRVGMVRFFCAGEYGSRYQRPHFHAILFGYAPSDERVLFNGERRSDELEAVWSHGHVHLGEVTAQSAAYVAGYTLEKRYGLEAYDDVVDPATGEVFERRPEFVCMSRRPGIGAEWFARFGGDLFPHDFAVSAGRRFKVPRYYRDRWEVSAEPLAVEAVREARYERAMAVDSVESSPERRAVREEAAWARVNARVREH